MFLKLHFLVDLQIFLILIGNFADKLVLHQKNMQNYIKKKLEEVNKKEKMIDSPNRNEVKYYDENRRINGTRAL